MSTMMRNQFQDAFFQRVPFIDHTIMDTYDMYPEQYSKFSRLSQVVVRSRTLRA